MNQTKSPIVVVSVLLIASIWALIALYQAGYVPSGLDAVIFALILISGVYAFVVHMKRHNDMKQGLPPDDELSNQIKYKAGYYAFLSSMYVWLFIFLFKHVFPDLESLLGTGILTSAVISIAIKAYLSRNYYANEN